MSKGVDITFLKGEKIKRSCEANFYSKPNFFAQTGIGRVYLTNKRLILAMRKSSLKRWLVMGFLTLLFKKVIYIPHSDIVNVSLIKSFKTSLIGLTFIGEGGGKEKIYLELSLQSSRNNLEKKRKEWFRELKKISKN